MPTRYQLLADGILIVHVLIVVLNVVALPVIWIGYARGWNFVRNFYFRVTHLALIGFIALEALVGWACPLTTWENELRFEATGQTSYESGFIVHWLRSLLFHDWPLWVFTVSYVGFFALVLVTYVWLKPMPRRRCSWICGASRSGAIAQVENGSFCAMKRSFCIVGWMIGSLAVTYVVGILLLKLVLVVLGVTVQDGKLIQALPYAVSLVVRGVWILIEAVAGIIFLVLGVKGKLPGTKRGTGHPSGS